MFPKSSLSYRLEQIREQIIQTIESETSTEDDITDECEDKTTLYDESHTGYLIYFGKVLRNGNYSIYPYQNGCVRRYAVLSTHAMYGDDPSAFDQELRICRRFGLISEPVEKYDIGDFAFATLWVLVGFVVVGFPITFTS